MKFKKKTSVKTLDIHSDCYFSHARHCTEAEKMSFYGALTGESCVKIERDNMVCSTTGNLGESATGAQRKALSGHARTGGFQGIQSRDQRAVGQGV